MTVRSSFASRDAGSRWEVPSARIRRTIRLVAGPLTVASERFLTHPRVAEIYPAYLIRVLGVMRGILAVMGMALDSARSLAATDPIAPGLALYLERHIAEETGHDAWVLDDLDVLGVGPATIDDMVPPAPIAELIGAQYYWVLHTHPVAVLGYLAVAEGDPMSPAMVERLRDATGHPDAAFRTLFEHAELDEVHEDELYALIDALPLTRRHEKLITISAMSAAGLMAEALEEVVETEGRIVRNR